MRQHILLELRGREDGGAAGRQHIAQAFAIQEKERLVALDGPAATGAELVGIGAGLGAAAELGEEVAGVQELAVEVVHQVSMERVAAGFSDQVFLPAGHAPVLRAEGVEYDGGFGDFIGAQQIIAGAGIVQVIVRIHHIRAIEGEQDGGARHAIGVHVAGAAFDGHPNSGDRHGQRGEVAARHGQFLDLLGGE